MRIESCFFILHDELEEKYKKEELCIGLIVECNWYLTYNQSILISNNFRTAVLELTSLNEVIFFELSFILFKL